MGFAAEERGAERCPEPRVNTQKNPEDSPGLLASPVSESHSGPFPDPARFSGHGIFPGILETACIFFSSSPQMSEKDSPQGGRCYLAEANDLRNACFSKKKGASKRPSSLRDAPAWEQARAGRWWQSLPLPRRHGCARVGRGREVSSGKARSPCLTPGHTGYGSNSPLLPASLLAPGHLAVCTSLAGPGGTRVWWPAGLMVWAELPQTDQSGTRGPAPRRTRDWVSRGGNPEEDEDSLFYGFIFP